MRRPTEDIKGMKLIFIPRIDEVRVAARIDIFVFFLFNVEIHKFKPIQTDQIGIEFEFRFRLFSSKFSLFKIEVS